MCKELMELVRLNERRFPCLKWFHHIPNEGKRNPLMAKQIGIKSGVSDYFGPVPTNEHLGLYLEIKKPGDKPTQYQERWMRDMTQLGYDCRWTDKLQIAFDIVLEYAAKATVWMKENIPELLENVETL